jgi:hypothetical protein
MWQMEATRSVVNNTATATRIIDHLMMKSKANANVATQDVLTVDSIDRRVLGSFPVALTSKPQDSVLLLCHQDETRSRFPIAIPITPLDQGIKRIAPESLLRRTVLP